MSRVFSVPLYKHATWNRVRFYAGDVSLAAKLVARYAAEGDSTQDLLDREFLPVAEAAEREFALSLGLKSSPDSLRNACRAGEEILAPILRRSKRIVVDDRAQFEVLAKYYSSGLEHRDIKSTVWYEMDEACRETAVMGLIASMASPIPAAETVRNTALFRRLIADDLVGAHCIACSEPWRMGISSKHHSEGMRRLLEGDPFSEPFDCLITKGSWHDMHLRGKATLFLDILLWELDGTTYILGRQQREEIAELLWSAGQLGIYCLNWRDRPDIGYSALMSCRKYLKDAMNTRIATGTRVDTLARQMKSSYAITVASFDESRLKGDDRVLLDFQRRALEREAMALCAGEVPWFTVTGTWDDTAAVDIGTLWNLLPAPHAIPELQDDAVRAKLNAPRDTDGGAWAEFIDYCGTVITAHLLTKHPEASGSWISPEDDPEQLEWVQQCRAGILTYPKNFDGTRLEGVFKWKKHIEWWEFTAKDVTHVSAAAEDYRSATSVAALDPSDTNELIYALTYGNLLSKKYGAEEVRRGFMEGRLPGDRLILLASKRENTKNGDPLFAGELTKTRETASADDVAREVFTEVDRNLATLARVVHGIGSRAGDAQIQVKMDSLLATAENNGVVISLDVSGWSPNMHRQGEMRFADLLMSFYDLPPRARMTSFFKDVDAVTSRNGFHSKWTTQDGSIQGFFGTIDTILHSLLMQWAVNRARKDGLIDPKAKVQKVALIDDIIAAISHADTNRRATLDHIFATYASLGFEADVVKTLMAARKGHFLNRLYAGRFEVLTAAKIFSRADREWERSLLTVWDMTSSAFGAFRGASDRGANPVACYVAATWRAYCSIAQFGKKGWRPTTEHALFVAWLSPGLCGYGFPSFGHWVSRSTESGLSAGLGAVTRVARTIRGTSPAAWHAIQAALGILTTATVKARSAVAFADDPFGVTLAIAVDPSEPIRRVMRLAQEKVVRDPAMRAMIDTSSSETYAAAVGAVVRAQVYPAPLLAEWASTLPHAVIRSLTIKAERNETLLSAAGWKARRAARVELRAANTKAVNAYAVLLRASAGNVEGIEHGISVLSALIAADEDASGFSASMRITPCASDVLAHVRTESEATMFLRIPKHTAQGMYEGIPGGRLARCIVSKPLVALPDTEVDSWDPVSTAYHVMLNVTGIGSALGYDTGPMAQMWGMAWTGTPIDTVPAVSTVTGSNPARLCSRTKRKVHSVSALPNFVSSVVVDMSRLIESLDSVHTTIDHMTILFTLKAAAIADCVCGGASRAGETRFYALGTFSHLVAADKARAKADFDPTCLEGVTPVLTGSARTALISAMESMNVYQGGADADEDETIPMIKVDFIKPDSILAAFRRIPAGTVSKALATTAGAGSASRVIPPARMADVIVTTRSAHSSSLDSGDSLATAKMVQGVHDIINAPSAAARTIVCNRVITHCGHELRMAGKLRVVEAILAGEDIDDNIDFLSKWIATDMSDREVAWATWAGTYRARYAAADHNYKEFWLFHILSGWSIARSDDPYYIWAHGIIGAAKGAAALGIRDGVDTTIDTTPIVSRLMEWFVEDNFGIGKVLAAFTDQIDGWDDFRAKANVIHGLKIALNKARTFFIADVVVEYIDTARVIVPVETQSVVLNMPNMVIAPDAVGNAAIAVGATAEDPGWAAWLTANGYDYMTPEEAGSMYDDFLADAARGEDPNRDVI